MRSAGRLAAVLIALTVLAFAATVILRDDRLAFTLGVTNGGPVAVLEPGSRVCQRDIPVPQGGGFDRVRLSLGTFERPGPPVAVTVRDTGGATIARGTLRGGYPDIASAPSHGVRVGEVGDERRIAVCVANEGHRKVAVYGNAGIASRTSSAVLDGKPQEYDLNLAFDTRERSIAAEWPAIADRAALFRAAWVGPWTYLVLALLVLVAVPVLLVRAVTTAERDGA